MFFNQTAIKLPVTKQRITIKCEYVFWLNNKAHILQFKPGSNSKLGDDFMIQTYHFSKEQIETGDLKLDAKICYGCPYSYNQNNGSSGGCYTHKGFQGLGIRSMLKAKHKKRDQIKPFDLLTFQKFISNVKETGVNFCRFGSYGEAVFLGKDLIKQLSESVNGNTSGYTHLWTAKKFEWAKNYLQASTDGNRFLASVALDRGWRVFNVGGEIENGVNCPASKEAGKLKTCFTCGLCDGVSENIYIKKH